MKVNLPFSLGAIRSITAAQLKAMYDAVATVLNGNLTRENFAPRAAISNAHKATPRSWVMLEGHLHTQAKGDGLYGTPASADDGPSVIRWKIPELAPSDRLVTYSVDQWSFVLGVPDVFPGAYTAGTVKLRYFAASGAAVVEKDVFAVGYLSSELRSGSLVVVPFNVVAGDVLEVQFTGFTFGGGATRIAGAAAAVWLKTEHLP